MKMIAVNGSPRKNGNTAVLLENALRGARENGAETRLVHLYDLVSQAAPAALPASARGIAAMASVRSGTA